ncbi:MAG: PEP-CTERM sorting domain-containing protein [Planctomycetales bacterium]
MYTRPILAAFALLFGAQTADANVVYVIRGTWSFNSGLAGDFLGLDGKAFEQTIAPLTSFTFNDLGTQDFTEFDPGMRTLTLAGGTVADGDHNATVNLTKSRNFDNRSFAFSVDQFIMGQTQYDLPANNARITIGEFRVSLLAMTFSTAGMPDPTLQSTFPQGNPASTGISEGVPIATVFNTSTLQSANYLIPIGGVTVQAIPQVIPEPSSCALLSLALAGGFWRLRQRKQQLGDAA